MTPEETIRVITETEARSKSNTKRLDEHSEKLRELEGKQDAIHDLTTSIKLLAQAQDNTNDKLTETNQKIDKVSNDVEDIKSKPAKKWEEITSKVIWTIVGGVIAFVLAKVGLGT